MISGAIVRLGQGQDRNLTDGTRLLRHSWQYFSLRWSSFDNASLSSFSSHIISWGSLGGVYGGIYGTDFEAKFTSNFFPNSTQIQAKYSSIGLSNQFITALANSSRYKPIKWLIPQVL